LPELPLRLLFDENLAERLVQGLARQYPGSQHVRNLALTAVSDRAIWEYARLHGFVLVTKDEDFHRLSILEGAPPKVIWIRLGNCSTEEVARLLRRRRSEVGEFLADEEAAFLALA
jgi:predicted nuclease of predicted toxin-antitoxin system